MNKILPGDEITLTRKKCHMIEVFGDTTSCIEQKLGELCTACWNWLNRCHKCSKEVELVSTIQTMETFEGVPQMRVCKPCYDEIVSENERMMEDW